MFTIEIKVYYVRVQGVQGVSSVQVLSVQSVHSISSPSPKMIYYFMGGSSEKAIQAATIITCGYDDPFPVQSHWLAPNNTKSARGSGQHRFTSICLQVEYMTYQ